MSFAENIRYDIIFKKLGDGGTKQSNKLIEAGTEWIKKYDDLRFLRSASCFQNQATKCLQQSIKK
jgi:hypothetical protein